MSVEIGKQSARKARAEFLLLLNWEQFVSELLLATAKFPKVIRFTLTQRIENISLSILEEFVIVRYRKNKRLQRLQEINLSLESLRFLLRVAFARQAMSAKNHEQLQRKINEIGKQLGAWTRSIRGTHGKS